ncbi:DUF2314 domain-containing protein [Yoonia maricola]|nr:DUF2314 domain-containing protein [Yoonia maricola]
MAPLAAPLTAQEGDPTVGVEATDQTMNNAIAAAQQSLPLFLCTATNAEGYGPEGGFLKVQVPVKSREIEHEIIWVGPFAAWDGENFAGILANQPNNMPGFNRGDQFDFTYDMIVDWSWRYPTGANYGDYTTRVLLSWAGDEAALAKYTTPPFAQEWSCE